MAATETSTAPPTSTSLTPALFKRLFPRPYLDRFLDESVRPDGRPIQATGAQAESSDVWRDVSVNVGEASSAQTLHG